MNLSKDQIVLAAEARLNEGEAIEAARMFKNQYAEDWPRWFDDAMRSRIQSRVDAGIPGSRKPY